jgi:hypothetical protein
MFDFLLIKIFTHTVEAYLNCLLACDLHIFIDVAGSALVASGRVMKQDYGMFTSWLLFLMNFLKALCSGDYGLPIFIAAAGTTAATRAAKS